jgi:hypothetical protein
VIALYTDTLMMIGRTYEGNFVNDNMTGKGWYTEQDKVIVGEFQNGVCCVHDV